MVFCPILSRLQIPNRCHGFFRLFNILWHLKYIIIFRHLWRVRPTYKALPQCQVRLCICSYLLYMEKILQSLFDTKETAFKLIACAFFLSMTACQQPLETEPLDLVKSFDASASSTSTDDLGLQPGRLEFFGSSLQDSITANTISYTLLTGTDRANKAVPLREDRFITSPTAALSSHQFSSSTTTLVFGCSTIELQEIANTIIFENDSVVDMELHSLSSSNTFQAQNIFICSENLLLGKYVTLAAKNIVFMDVNITSTTEAGSSKGALNIYSATLNLVGQNKIQLRAYQSPQLRRPGPSLALSVDQEIKTISNGSLEIHSQGSSWPTF